MKIPSLFYGPRSQVVPRVRKLARQLLKDGNFACFDPGPLLDTADVEGQILVDSPIILSQKHFHCYALSEELVELSEQSQVHANVHAWLMASLNDEWRFMCTLGGLSRLGLKTYDASFARLYVEAAIRHWPVMSPEHERFHNMLEPTSVLKCWFTLMVALDILGLPVPEQIKQPSREPKDLLALIDRRGESRG
jgi:hypothetical protein